MYGRTKIPSKLRLTPSLDPTVYWDYRTYVCRHTYHTAGDDTQRLPEVAALDAPAHLQDFAL